MRCERFVDFLSGLQRSQRASQIVRHVPGFDGERRHLKHFPVLEQLRMLLVELYLLGRADRFRREHHALHIRARQHLSTCPLERLHDRRIAIELVVHGAVDEQLLVDQRIHRLAGGRGAGALEPARVQGLAQLRDRDLAVAHLRDDL